MKTIDSSPILSCAEAGAWEKQILKTESSEWNAMQQAGDKIAHSIFDDFQEIGGLQRDARLLILVGKGHNGGDALLAARTILQERPAATVEIVFCFGEAVLRPLAQRALDELRRTAPARCRNLTFNQLKIKPADYDLCLDGVFGFKFRPPMDRATARIMTWVNSSPSIKIRAAVDLPSGLGQENARTVFRADFTYATGVVKAPVVAEANGAWVGRLRYLDLGFFDQKDPAADQRVLTDKLLAPLAALRSSQSDKRTFGHLCVVGGSHSYPGAVMLAVRAALRSGVGLITALVPESLTPHYAAEHPEVMWVGCPQNSAGGLSLDCLPLLQERLKRTGALLVGPGLGADDETIELVRRIAAEVKVPIALDADALRPEVIDELKGKPFVCTPHAGEFKRIAGKLSLREFCKKQGGVVVLKGPLTQVGSSASQFSSVKTQRGLKHGAALPAIYWSPFGGPVLARGGSGDMLAGLIGGLLAQTPGDPLLAACRGVVWHGIAADLLARTYGQVAVENSQLLEQLGPALQSTHDRIINGAAGVHGSE